MINKIDIKNNIYIKNAYLNNLKNINLIIPKNKLIFITGVSGSGKSTLAFDILYTEGQRKYIESLSSFLRQFLGKLKKPLVEDIKGLVPAIAIKQKMHSTNPRSTVGTLSEIYDYLKLLYSRIGKTYSPISGAIVKKQDVSDVIKFIKIQSKKEDFLLLSPIKLNSKISFLENMKILKNQGFVRIRITDKNYLIEDVIKLNLKFSINSKLFLIIDRFSTFDNKLEFSRIADSVESAFYEGSGICILYNIENNKFYEFSNFFSIDGLNFPVPNIHLFNFNNPLGRCEKCKGYGKIIDIDKNLVIPNKFLSIYEDAVVCWKGDTMKKWKQMFIKIAKKYKISIYKPYNEFSEIEKKILWEGTKEEKSINHFFKFVHQNSFKIQYRVLLSRYQRKSICPECKGTRLNKDTENIKIESKCLGELLNLSISNLDIFFKKIDLSNHDLFISKRLLIEIKARINFLKKVGLSYLTLNRNANTLSGGELQRINLATTLGSNLVGSMYILDEPSVGLHVYDTNNLIFILKKLRDLGNTVIIVEHDENLIKESDYIIDIGPKAGNLGGKITYNGKFKNFLESKTLTSKYLNQEKKIEFINFNRKLEYFIQIRGASENNLKNIDVDIPLHSLTVITGVSGSGKSSLIKSILVPFLEKKFNIYNHNEIGEVCKIKGDLHRIKNFQFINQNSIGKSSRSNPITYIKVYDDIRDLFSDLPDSKINMYSKKFFSFNLDNGRCEKCKGEGVISIPMQFMSDIDLICDLCKGKKFKKEILSIKFNNKNIFDVLEFNINEAIIFFKKYKITKIVDKLIVLQDIGLGYLKLGQSVSTLSGGEAQRLKLASFLLKGANQPSTLFIFDEPSNGLHFYDIQKLLNIFYKLLNNNHSIIMTEHNLDLIKCADYIIDLGPLGGENGGNVVAKGTLKEIIDNKNSITGKFLKKNI